MFVSGEKLDGGQLVPPEGPGAITVVVSPNGVKICFALRTGAFLPSVSRARSRICLKSALLTSWEENGGYEGIGWVSAVACDGSCGTGCSSIGWIGSPVSRSRM